MTTFPEKKTRQRAVAVTGRSRGSKVCASIALVAVIYAGLASCRGGGVIPLDADGGDEMTPQQQPDLALGASVSDNTPVVGATFTLSVTVQNDGDGASVATTLRYYRSMDATITISDTEVGTDTVAELAASGTSSVSVDVTAPAVAGTYYYGACVDAVADESDTSNNCSASVQVTVPEPDEPDLVVAAPTVSNSTPAVGATFTLSVTVQNDGDGASAATTLRYYRSMDATITISDTEVGTDTVAELAASGTSSVSVDVTAPRGRRDLLLRGVRRRGGGRV